MHALKNSDRCEKRRIKWAKQMRQEYAGRANKGKEHAKHGHSTRKSFVTERVALDVQKWSHTLTAATFCSYRCEANACVRIETKRWNDKRSGKEKKNIFWLRMTAFRRNAHAVRALSFIRLWCPFGPAVNSKQMRRSYENEFSCAARTRYTNEPYTNVLTLDDVSAYKMWRGTCIACML